VIPHNVQPAAATAAAIDPAAQRQAEKEARRKENQRRRLWELVWLVGLSLLPWVLLFFCLPLIPGMKDSNPWGGRAKFGLFVFAALLILVYERLFIWVTRRAVEGKPGKSPYKFSRSFLRKPDDPALDEAMQTWLKDPSLANRTEALKKIQTVTDDNEGFKRLTQVTDKLQSRIGEEYSDIHSRTGWLVAGQAFLLGAFVTVLNAEHLSAELRQWLSIGIALVGAAISFVLALSIFYGTALVEALKVPRDRAETLAKRQFKVPRTGVPRRMGVHTFGHYATRYIPCLAYVAWIALTLLAMDGAFGQVTSSGSGHARPGGDQPGNQPGGSQLGGDQPGGNQPGGDQLGGNQPGGNQPGGDQPGGNQPIGTSGRGWKELTASPSFALGAATFEAGKPDCPDPTEKELHNWLDSVMKDWQGRASPSKSDVLILVGSADRIRLRGALQHQYDTNMGLARRRAEDVKTLLEKATAHKSEIHQLTDKRVLVLVTGPQHSPEAGKPILGQKESCKDFPDDRRVQVWLPSGG
jgi:hypothetical protein